MVQLQSAAAEHAHDVVRSVANIKSWMPSWPAEDYMLLDFRRRDMPDSEEAPQRIPPWTDVSDKEASS